MTGNDFSQHFGEKMVSARTLLFLLWRACQYLIACSWRGLYGMQLSFGAVVRLFLVRVEADLTVAASMHSIDFVFSVDVELKVPSLKQISTGCRSLGNSLVS